MSQQKSWKEHLADRMPPEWADEIDVFEGQMALRSQNKLDERVFAETRLRRGAYGQRYDNGQRHDGIRSRTLAFPSEGLTRERTFEAALPADLTTVLDVLRRTHGDTHD